ncbi:hypothetical protein DC843_26025 [Vibrio parahaemolyticus]|nr:hypothetical protein [Vibrio parahaemolyticus]
MKNVILSTIEHLLTYRFFQAYNVLLSSEACNTKASALLRKHQNHCKPKMPRMPNLLEQFVMFYHN